MTKVLFRERKLDSKDITSSKIQCTEECSTQFNRSTKAFQSNEIWFTLSKIRQRESTRLQN